jgi:cobalt-zinc-cadmium efflux system membrane fusion protein
MSRKLFALFALVAAVVILIAPFSPRLRAEGVAPSSDMLDIALDDRSIRAAGISFAAVERERGATELSFPGTIAVPPLRLRVVAAPVGGLVEMVEVAPDELVSAGQAILLMRSPGFVELQRDFISADADATLARDWLRRAEQLMAGRALPERELRQAETQARTATYRADERRHALKLMGMTDQEIEKLQRTREFQHSIAIHAPVAGAVLIRHINAGARVAVAEPLFTIAQLDPLWVNIQVPAPRLGSITVGSPVTLAAHGASGRIIRVGRSVDPATQSVTAVAEIDTNAGSVRPGLAVTATVRVAPNGTAQWVVPAASVVRHSDRSWVFVRTPEGARAQPVEVLSENARDAAIRAALAPSDQVAVRGLIALLAELAKADTE